MWTNPDQMTNGKLTKRSKSLIRQVQVKGGYVVVNGVPYCSYHKAPTISLITDGAGTVNLRSTLGPSHMEQISVAGRQEAQ